MNKQKIVVGMEELSPLLLGIIAEGHTVTLTVAGNSMRPMLRDRRDRVVLERCDPLCLCKGDLPLYRRENGKYVLHRIVGVGSETYDFAGDAQTEIERDVPKKNILAVVRGFYRKGRYRSCSRWSYRMYTGIWLRLFPVRRYLFKLYGFLRGMVR